MKDVNKAIRIAYASVLDGTITYAGRVVPVYAKFIPVDATYPLILISNQFGSNDSSKNSFETTHTVDIEVVGRSQNAGVGSQVDDIAYSVLQILGKMEQGDYPIMPEGFFLTDLKMTETNEMFDRDANYSYVRRIITFVNEVEQV